MCGIDTLWIVTYSPQVVGMNPPYYKWMKADFAYSPQVWGWNRL